jgi:hypothetical protein
MNAPRIARRKVCQTLSPKTNRYFAATLRKIIPNQYEAISNRHALHSGWEWIWASQRVLAQGTGGAPIGFFFAAQKPGLIDDENP